MSLDIAQRFADISLVMPQHPEYFPEVSENVSSLYNLLADSLRYGFIHEDSVSSMDGAFERLYRPDKHEDEDSYSLCDYVDSLGLTGDDAWQFVQDLRNATSIVLSSNQFFSSEELAQRIKDARDLAYLKQHLPPA
jgi:hypothetical protein